MDLNIKRKERKALNSSLYSLTHRNARTIKLVSLRVRCVTAPFFTTPFVIPTNPLLCNQVSELMQRDCWRLLCLYLLRAVRIAESFED